MSEEVAKRSIPEIQQEYQNLAMKAGHTQYQIYTLERDLDLMNQNMRDLNNEAAKVQQEEKLAAAQAAPAQESV